MKKIWIKLRELDSTKKELLFTILDSMEKKYTIAGHGTERKVIFKMSASDRWRILDKEDFTWWQNK